MTAHSEWQYFHCQSDWYNFNNDVTSMFAINTKTMQASKVFWRFYKGTSENFQKLLNGNFKKYKVKEYTTGSKDQLRWKKWGRKYHLDRESLILEEHLKNGLTWLDHDIHKHVGCVSRSLNTIKEFAKGWDEEFSEKLNKRRL